MVDHLETVHSHDLLLEKISGARWKRFEESLLVLAHGRIGTGNFLPDLDLGPLKIPSLQDRKEIFNRFERTLPTYHEGHNSNRSFNGVSENSKSRKEDARNLVADTATELCVLSHEFKSRGWYRPPTFCQLAATIFLKTAHSGIDSLEFRDALHYINSVSKNASPAQRAQLPWRGAASHFFESIDQRDSNNPLFDQIAKVFIQNPGQMLTTTEILKKVFPGVEHTPVLRVRLGNALEILELLGLAEPHPWHVPSAVSSDRNIAAKPLDVYSSSIGKVRKPGWLYNSPLEIMKTLYWVNGPISLTGIRELHLEQDTVSHPMTRRCSMRMIIDALVDSGYVTYRGSRAENAKGREFSLSDKGSTLISSWVGTENDHPLPAEPYDQLRIGVLGLWGKCHS